jgi:hypothetical protein
MKAPKDINNIKIEVVQTWLERNAESATKWLGSTSSLIFHTILFIVSGSLPFFGVPFDVVLLVVTTAVSLKQST